VSGYRVTAEYVTATSASAHAAQFSSDWLRVPGMTIEPRAQFYRDALLPDDVPEDELARLAVAGLVEAVPDDAA
jgi:hypothetical protein